MSDEPKRYRLPDALGGAEVEVLHGMADTDGRSECRVPDVFGLVRVPSRDLVEVPPPYPPEPEPGDYLLGDVLCRIFTPGGRTLCFDDVLGSCFTHDWPHTWARFGGPNVVPRRLVPEPERREDQRPATMFEVPGFSAEPELRANIDSLTLTCVQIGGERDAAIADRDRWQSRARAWERLHHAVDAQRQLYADLIDELTRG